VSDGSTRSDVAPSAYARPDDPRSVPVVSTDGAATDGHTPIAASPGAGSVSPSEAIPWEPVPSARTASHARPVPFSGTWLARRRARARKVRRTVRHIDPWSVFKISVLLYLCLYVAVMIAGVLLWSAAVGSGLVGNIESFIEELLALETYEFQADEIFRGGAIIGLVLAAAGAAFSVVLAILFNLISDLTGGVRVTVLEEDEAVPLLAYQQYAEALAEYHAEVSQQGSVTPMPAQPVPTQPVPTQPLPAEPAITGAGVAGVPASVNGFDPHAVPPSPMPAEQGSPSTSGPIPPSPIPPSPRRSAGPLAAPPARSPIR